jgi:hypothetical protein
MPNTTVSAAGGALPAASHERVPSRRAILAAAPALALAAAGAVAIGATGHPDTELLAAWSDIKEMWRQIEAMPDSAERDRLVVAFDKRRDDLERLPTKTVGGINVKLAYLFWLYSESRKSELIVMDNLPYDIEGSDYDYRDEMLWNLIEDVKKMGASA